MFASDEIRTLTSDHGNLKIQVVYPDQTHPNPIHSLPIELCGTFVYSGTRLNHVCQETDDKCRINCVKNDKQLRKRT